MAYEETKFPYFCDCCDVPVVLKDKQSKYYHISKSNRAKSLRGEMLPVKAKRPRVFEPRRRISINNFFFVLDLLSNGLIMDLTFPD